MPNNISLKSLELATTLRVLSDRLIDRKSCQYKTTYHYREVLEQCMFALDDILIERGLNKEFWARIRGDRLFLFYLPLKRIGIEVGIVTDDAGNNLRKNFYMQFIGYRGKVPPKTIADLIEILEESSQRHQRKRNQYEQHHQRNAEQRRTNRCMPIRHKDGYNRISSKRYGQYKSVRQELQSYS